MVQRHRTVVVRTIVQRRVMADRRLRTADDRHMERDARCLRTEAAVTAGRLTVEAERHRMVEGVHRVVRAEAVRVAEEAGAAVLHLVEAVVTPVAVVGMEDIAKIG